MSSRDNQLNWCTYQEAKKIQSDVSKRSLLPNANQANSGFQILLENQE